MAHRSRPTTNKRQREQARIAKRNDKAARMEERRRSAERQAPRGHRDHQHGGNRGGQAEPEHGNPDATRLTASTGENSEDCTTGWYSESAIYRVQQIRGLLDSGLTTEIIRGVLPLSGRA